MADIRKRVTLLSEDVDIVIFNVEITDETTLLVSVGSGVDFGEAKIDKAAIAADLAEHAVTAASYNMIDCPRIMRSSKYLKDGSHAWVFKDDTVEWSDHFQEHPGTGVPIVGYRIKVPAARLAGILNEMVALLA